MPSTESTGRAESARRIAAMMLAAHAHQPDHIARGEAIADMVGAIIIITGETRAMVSSLMVAIAGLASAGACSAVGRDITDATLHPFSDPDVVQ